jgi:threonine aldolase
MDGARFANAAARRSQDVIHAPPTSPGAPGVDVLSFGGTKNGMLTTEAVVFFNRDLARDFAYR